MPVTGNSKPIILIKQSLKALFMVRSNHPATYKCDWYCCAKTVFKVNKAILRVWKLFVIKPVKPLAFFVCRISEQYYCH